MTTEANVTHQPLKIKAQLNEDILFRRLECSSVCYVKQILKMCMEINLGTKTVG